MCDFSSFALSVLELDNIYLDVSGNEDVSGNTIIYTDNTDIVSSIDNLSYICSAILFFLVFWWVSVRIYDVVQKFTKSDKR